MDIVLQLNKGSQSGVGRRGMKEKKSQGGKNAAKTPAKNLYLEKYGRES